MATLSFFLLEVGAYEIKKIIFEGSGHSKLLFTNSFLVGMGCKSPGRKHKYFFYIFRTAKFLPHKPIWGSASTVNTQCATVQNFPLGCVSTSLIFFAHNFFMLQDPFGMLHQYHALTQDSDSLLLALQLIKRYNFAYECHANRTRFWVESTHPQHTFVALRFACIDHEHDHALGV